MHSMPVKYFLFITLQMHYNQETTRNTAAPPRPVLCCKANTVGTEIEDRGSSRTVCLSFQEQSLGGIPELTLGPDAVQGDTGLS